MTGPADDDLFRPRRPTGDADGSTLILRAWRRHIDRRAGLAADWPALAEGIRMLVWEADEEGR